MASDYYLLLNGVKGESQAQGMTDYIELDSFSFGASAPPDVSGSTGLSGGKPSLSDFSFSCSLDKASPTILNNLYNGTHIADATFIGRKTGGGGTPYNYLEVTLTNCLVTSHATGGGGSGSMPTISCSLAYKKIQYQYFTQDTSTGGTTNAGSATYDIALVQQS